MGVTRITLESGPSLIGDAGSRGSRTGSLSRAVSGGLAIAAVTAGVAVVAPDATVPRTTLAAIRLLDTAIGVGPSFDGFGATIPLLFYGTAVPSGDTFYTVPYPAMINLDYPIISSLPILSAIPYWPQTLKRSEEVGAGYLEQAIAGEPSGEKLTVIGYSQGTQVGEIARADMAKNATYVANAQDYNFVFVGDPYQPNGGILSRFTAFANLPIIGDLFPLGRPGPSDSPFKTTYYQNEYDGFADFPEYFNPLAIVNALLGIVFEHVLPGYVFESSDGPNTVSTTVGNTTYVSIPQYLPLLTPLRLAASLIGAQRFVNALDPILRVFVEMGYNRTADPSQVGEFSFLTPLQTIRQGLQQLPAAIAEGLRILGGASYNPTMPQPVVSATEPTTPVTDHPALPVDSSPLAQAVRAVVVNISKAITRLTQPLATLLRIIGGKSTPAPTATTSTAAAPAAVTAAATPTATTQLAAIPVTPTASGGRKASLTTSPTSTSADRRPPRRNAKVTATADAATTHEPASTAPSTAPSTDRPATHRHTDTAGDARTHAPTHTASTGKSTHGR